MRLPPSLRGTFAMAFMAGGLTLGYPLLAQEGGALRDGVKVHIDQTPGGTELPSQAAAVDDRALRYYASQYDYARVDQEIARLKASHPGWEPPQDLFGSTSQPPAQVDTSTLWAAYDRGDFEAVRRDITALRGINPGWQPPEKLVQLMSAAETRAAMKEAIDTGEWAAVVELAERHPELVAAKPEYIENLWMVAEAEFRLGNPTRAYALYRTVWDGEVATDLRLSTLQKALANPNQAGLRQLFALESERSRDASQDARLAEIRRDFAGGGGATGAQSQLGLSLANLSAGKVTPDELARIEQSAQQHRHADAAQVLGWYYYAQDDLPAAELWFNRSLAWGPSAEAAEGLARTLLASGDPKAAEALARQWSDRAPAVAAVLEEIEGQGKLERASPRERLALTTAEMRDGERVDPGVLVARGWALFDLDRASEATLMFERARERTRAGSKTQADATYGLAHAQTARGLTEDARALLREDSLNAEQRSEVEQVITRREAAEAYRTGRYAESLELVRTLRAQEPNDTSLAALEAWNLLELGQLSEARAIFAELHAIFPTEETKKGLKAVRQRQYPASTWM